MFTNRFPSAILAIAVSLLPSAAGAQVFVADSLVDAVGVNLHMHYFDSGYANFPFVQGKLVELGVRHVRDGLIDTEWMDYYQRFKALAQVGIKTTFITAPEQSEELWKSYPARMGAAFEAFEGPNELDRFGDPNWVRTLTDAVIRLSRVKNDPRSAGFPVIGPSLQHQNSYSLLGDLSAYYDAGNIHNYLGGRFPCTTGWGDGGYGSIPWSLGNIDRFAGRKPVIATENGYQTAGSPDAIPEEIAGRYTPRMLLEQFRAGIKRTYLYELLDWRSSGNFGLLRQDGTAKPAFMAVKNLLTMLKDPGPVFTPQPFAYTVTGGSTDVRHMLFQKRDGTYFLFLWLGVPSYDPATRRYVNVPAQTVTVRLPKPMRLLNTHRWRDSGLVSTVSSKVTATALSVGFFDMLTVLELAAPPR